MLIIEFLILSINVPETEYPRIHYQVSKIVRIYSAKLTGPRMLEFLEIINNIRLVILIQPSSQIYAFVNILKLSIISVFVLSGRFHMKMDLTFLTGVLLIIHRKFKRICAELLHPVASE
jgi:hypothetical protein